jgi:hypothetical protein
MTLKKGKRDDYENPTAPHRRSRFKRTHDF